MWMPRALGDTTEHHLCPLAPTPLAFPKSGVRSALGPLGASPRPLPLMGKKEVASTHQDSHSPGACWDLEHLYFWLRGCTTVRGKMLSLSHLVTPWVWGILGMRSRVVTLSQCGIPQVFTARIPSGS